ncbi:MAG: hypothetical protein ABL878_08725 [Burkholderiales bacterium]
MQMLLQTVELEITGPVSDPPLRGVCSALACIHGVQRVVASPDGPHVMVTFDALKVSTLQFGTAVRVMGCDIERLITQAPESIGGYTPSDLTTFF